MKRFSTGFLFSVFAVLVFIAAGGWTALWFVGQGEAKEQVARALASLSRAGADSRYEAIEVSGFPFGYRAEVRRLQVESDSGKVTLPQVSAEVTLDAADTVTFALPPRFEVLDKRRGALFVIASENMTADVTPSEQDAYNLALSAASLVINTDAKGAPGPTALKEFRSSGVFTANPDDARLSLSMNAAEFVQKFRLEEGDGEALTGEVKATRLNLAIEGALDVLSAKVSADSALANFDAGGVVEILKFEYAARAKPKERFDPAPLRAASDFRSVVEAFTAMARKGVVEGGAAETRLSFASLKGSGSIEDRPNNADVESFALELNFGAQKVGAKAEAKKLLIDLRLPDETEYYLSAEDQTTHVEATPREAFDFSIAASPNASAELVVQAIGAEIYNQVLEGGAIEFIGRSGPSVSRNIEPSSTVPFKQIESRSKGGTSRVSLTPDEAVVKFDVQGISYTLKDGLEGEADLSSFKLDFHAPMRAAAERQKARLRLALGEIVLDDQLWTLIDPQSALQREIDGLSLNAEAEVTIRRDLISPTADLFKLSDPAVLPGRLSVADTKLGLLGVRAGLSGGVNVFPLPNGGFVVDLSGWRQFFEAVQKTPLTEDPQFVSALLKLNDLVVNYGVPADPAQPEADALTFEIRLAGPTSLRINGKPYPQ